MFFEDAHSQCGIVRMGGLHVHPELEADHLVFRSMEFLGVMIVTLW